LIRERQRKIFGLAGPKPGSRSRIPVTPANFLEVRLNEALAADSFACSVSAVRL
jgi:hypothetical protein